MSGFPMVPRFTNNTDDDDNSIHLKHNIVKPIHFDHLQKEAATTTITKCSRIIITIIFQMYQLMKNCKDYSEQ